jgi:hypothetical protein
MAGFVKNDLQAKYRAFQIATRGRIDKFWRGFVMSNMIHPLPNSLRGERTLFSISTSVDDLPRGRFADKHLALLNYWSSKIGDETAPRRTSIDPLDIPRLLPNLLLWDVGSNNDYLCRLSGSEIDLSMGMPLKGHWLGEMKCPLIDAAMAEFHTSRDRAIPSFVERTMGWLGKPYLFYRHLLLPLSNERGQIHMLASCMTFHPVADLH